MRIYLMLGSYFYLRIRSALQSQILYKSIRLISAHGVIQLVNAINHFSMFYRFVLMVDCNHTIESKALDQYFSATFKDGEIMLKGCPLCGMPITKTLRFMNFVKRMYQQIAEMKTKTFEDLRSFDLKKMFQNLHQITYQCSSKLIIIYATCSYSYLS